MADLASKKRKPEVGSTAGAPLPASSTEAGSRDVDDLGLSPSVGEVLKIIRLGARLTQIEMADRLNVSLRTYARLEKGEMPTQPAARARVAAMVRDVSAAHDAGAFEGLAKLRPVPGEIGQTSRQPKGPAGGQVDQQLFVDMIGLMLERTERSGGRVNTEAVIQAALAACRLVQRAGGDVEARRDVEAMIAGLLDGAGAAGGPRYDLEDGRSRPGLHEHGDATAKR